MTKRVAFYLFYDKHGIVSDYIPYKLKCLREHVDTIFVVSNSKLDDENRRKLEEVADTVYCRQNVGFDVWAYKEAMETFGIDKLPEYDELILMNYTFFGPIFPFSEMFNAMEVRNCDFWGISDHDRIVPNPFTGVGVLPAHIQSHFIAVKRHMFMSDAFRDYWRAMPMIRSYEDSILRHESRFTEHFNNQGFTHSVYSPYTDYPSHYPLFMTIEKTLENRCPIIKRRPFFHEPLAMDQFIVDLRGVMTFIRDKTDYDAGLIWKDILRTVPPKDLHANLDMLEVFPSESAVPIEPVNARIAAIAHVYYPEMMEEICSYLKNIPYDYDLYITTASEDSKNEIETYLKAHPVSRNSEIRVVEQNRGRDMSSLFISCRDINLEDKYDYVCRVHSKKSPQVNYNAATSFKMHMYKNLLDSKSYVREVIGFFEKNPYIGFLMPTMIHIGYPTLGNAWFTNKNSVKELAKKLDIKTPFDDIVPHAAYGTMFWYRPKALRKLFAHPWKWEDFNAEPYHVDGGPAHALERLLAYASHDAGYAAYNISTISSIARDYTKLEYKANQAMSTVKSFSYIIYQFKLYLLIQHPGLARVLKVPYQILRHALKTIKKWTK